MKVDQFLPFAVHFRCRIGRINLDPSEFAGGAYAIDGL